MRGAQHYAAYLRCRVAGDALKNSTVLAVHGNYLAGARCTGLPNQISSDDECFLIRQRDTLPSLERSQRCVESRCPDYGVENDVDVVPSHGGNERLGPTFPFFVTVALGFDHSDE